ncbi:hypothetical protein COY91_01175 [Candidatus Shapirobacteria bacterium CG_4_10_14_0_8_um_filter_39_15]|nr:MAG: hypothetical protein COY91_01175 [Candidatus Shapirobacteria bacterium CG_4_10_14_0_8_um_filter_39_15]
MPDRLLKLLPQILITIIIVNVVFLDFYLGAIRKTETPAESLVPVVQPTAIPIQATENCSSCQAIVEKEVAKQISLIPSPTLTKTPTPTLTFVNSPKVFYIPLVNTGSTVLTEWTDIPGSDFYFNLTDYSGAKSVQWEASLKSVNSPARAMVRLYDVTNKRGVDYSELQTQSITYALLQSSAITIWRGNNLYRVQLKADNGTQADLGAGRLKIIY